MDCGMSCKIISLNLNWFLWLEVVRDYNKAAKERERRQDKNDWLMMLVMATLRVRVRVYVCLYVCVQTMQGSHEIQISFSYFKVSQVSVSVK